MEILVALDAIDATQDFRSPSLGLSMLSLLRLWPKNQSTSTIITNQAKIQSPVWIISNFPNPKLPRLINRRGVILICGQELRLLRLSGEEHLMGEISILICPNVRKMLHLSVLDWRGHSFPSGPEVRTICWRGTRLAITVKLGQQRQRS